MEIFYILGKRNSKKLLIFSEASFRAQKKKKKKKKKRPTLKNSYISGNVTF